MTVCRFLARCWIACLALCVLAAGCTSKAYVPKGDEAEHLRQLAVGYMRYVTENKGKSPTSERQFKQFLGSLGYDRAKIEGLFVSPRDAKPYVVAYNVPLTGATAVVVAHEQDGVDGTRYIAFDFGGVEMADEARFRQLVLGARTQSFVSASDLT